MKRALVGLWLVGCGSSSGKNTNADASPVDAVVQRTATGTIIAAEGSGVIVGASVCIVGDASIPCATSDGSGSYTIGLPDVTTQPQVAVNVTAAGFLGFTGLLTENTEGVLWFSQIPLFDNADATAQIMTPAGFTYPSTDTAFIQASVFLGSGGAAVGATVTVSPAGDTGAVYASGSGTPEPSLQAVTSDGYLWFGGLTPGGFDLTVAGVACTPATLSDEEWPSALANSVSGVTVADSMTQVTIVCD
jgi:hypothetical protein